MSTVTIRLITREELAELYSQIDSFLDGEQGSIPGSTPNLTEGALGGLPQTGGGSQPLSSQANRASSASSMSIPTPIGRQRRDASSASPLFIRTPPSPSPSTPTPTIRQINGNGDDRPSSARSQAIGEVAISIPEETSESTGSQLNTGDFFMYLTTSVFFTGVAIYLSWLIGNKIGNALPEQKNELAIVALASNGTVLSVGGAIYLLNEIWRSKRENNNALTGSQAAAQNIELRELNV